MAKHWKGDGHTDEGAHSHEHVHGGATHKKLIEDLEHEFLPILENSTDGVYLWLGDEAKFCNEKLAKMFGYTKEEWKNAKVFLEDMVHGDDAARYADNYNRCVAALAHPVSFRFMAKRKDGSYFAAETDMIPLMYKDHVVAYHFVRELK